MTLVFLVNMPNNEYICFETCFGSDHHLQTAGKAYIKTRPTQRADDWWDSAAFSSIFLASGFFCSQAESTPAHQRLTQTVSHLLAKHKSFEIP
jgi:hypothetical protein